VNGLLVVHIVVPPGAAATAAVVTRTGCLHSTVAKVSVVDSLSAVELVVAVSEIVPDGAGGL
jgi:hypothetical protein